MSGGLLQSSGRLRRQYRANDGKEAIGELAGLLDLSRRAFRKRRQLLLGSIAAGPAPHDLDIYRHTTQGVP